MFGLGIGELVVIAVILLFFFGPKKLPQLGQGLGEAIREFRKAGQNLHNESTGQELTKVPSHPPKDSSPKV